MAASGSNARGAPLVLEFWPARGGNTIRDWGCGASDCGWLGSEFGCGTSDGGEPSKFWFVPAGGAL